MRMRIRPTRTKSANRGNDRSIDIGTGEQVVGDSVGNAKISGSQTAEAAAGPNSSHRISSAGISGDDIAVSSTIATQEKATQAITDRLAVLNDISLQRSKG